jgi:hypothetical protein
MGCAGLIGQTEWDKTVRNRWLAGISISWLIVGATHARPILNDEVFANAALRELHNLAVASVKLAQATKDGDDLGCKYANESMEEAAHKALENMHYMSFAPVDAVEAVSRLLRLAPSTQPSGCYADSGANLVPLTAGQAIMALRWDYAIGDEDWYVIETNGDITGKNPLRYSQSLKDQNYSWISTRPKNMVFIVESDWKSEMESDQVADSSLENSGNSVQAIEVDYRKASNDETTEVYFYRTKDGAVAAAQEQKKRADDHAQAEAERKAAESDWKKKLELAPFLVANRDVGFKLIYGICKSAYDLNGKAKCVDIKTEDWSDDPRLPYKWFSDIDQCNDALKTLFLKHAFDVKNGSGDFFTRDCLPAPKASRKAARGYQMVFTLSAPAPISDRLSYENFRESASGSATLFKSFNDCRSKIDDAYSTVEKYLKVDEDGKFLSDKTKSITGIAYCVPVY